MKIQVKTLLKFEIVYILYIRLFIDYLGVPGAAWYLCDFINIILLLYALPRVYGVFKNIGANFYFKFFALFFGCTLLGFILNGTSAFLYIWGWRNIGRMFVLWVCCVVYFSREDLYQVLRYLFIAFIINYFVSLFQFFVQGIKGDNLGGIFGIEGASNSFTLNLLLIITMLSFCMYLQKKISLTKLVICVGISVIVSPLAELKAFYVLFVVGCAIVLVFQKKIAARTIFIAIIGCLGVLVAFNILSKVFPKSVAVLNLEGIVKYLAESEGEIGYSSVGDLSRFTALSTIYEMFFKGDVVKQLFGFGLGSCETSNFAIFNSAFYEQYEYLHYRWFFHAMTYLEMGALGIIQYLVYYASIFIYALKKQKHSTGDSHCLYVFSLVMVLFASVLMIYNSSLRIESGYLMYFVLSLPFIIAKEDCNEEDGRLSGVMKLTTKKIVFMK